MNRASTTFELTGMPGSGKSTIHAAVRKALVEVGVEAPQAPDTDEAEAYVRRRAPRFWTHSLRYIEEVAQRRHATGHGRFEKLLETTRALWFGRVHGVWTADEWAGGGPAFFEEATVHEYWRMVYLLGGDDRAMSWRVWRPAPKCSTIIWLRVAAPTRWERIGTKRTLGPINRDLHSHPPDGTVWTESEAAYFRLVRRATRLTGKLVVIENDDPTPDAAVRTIVDLVTKPTPGSLRPRR